MLMEVPQNTQDSLNVNEKQLREKLRRGQKSEKREKRGENEEGKRGKDS